MLFTYKVDNLDIVGADFYCKSSITNDSCTLEFQSGDILAVCYNMGDRCNGFTYNIGPRTATFKQGTNGKPKFALGITTIYKNKFRHLLKLKESEDCAPVMVSIMHSCHQGQNGKK